MSDKPAEVFPPHEYIAELMQERGWTVHDLARAMGMPAVEAAVVMTGAEPISPLHARRLARAFGTSSTLWLNLQRAWQT